MVDDDAAVVVDVAVDVNVTDVYLVVGKFVLFL